MAIDVDQNLREYFRRMFVEARKEQKISLSAFAEVYVLDLLERALDTHKIFSTDEHSEIDEPLALILSRAVYAEDRFQKIRLLKNIGDRSLYVSGFFSDSLTSKAVDIDYYVSMGKGDYKFVADLSATRSSSLGGVDVFDELSSKFSELVELISRVSENSGLTDDENILRVYERWMSTKSKQLEGRLRSEGIIPIEGAKGKPH